MAQKIEVGYTPAAIVGGLGIYHKYIIYDKGNGEVLIARAGPGYFGPGAESGGRDKPSESLIYGNITDGSGVYDNNNKDWDWGRDKGNPDNPYPDATPHP